MQINSVWNYFWTIAAWILFFNLSYQILRRKIPIPSRIAALESPAKRSREFSAHVFNYISLFHALANLAISSYIYFVREFYWLETNQPDTIHLMCFSAGYYISNTIMGQLYKFHPWSMVAHHLVVITEIFYVFYKGIFGNVMAVGFAIAEASNPFRIVKNISDGHIELAWLGELSIKLFAVIFLIFRFLNQSLLLHCL